MNKIVPIIMLVLSILGLIISMIAFLLSLLSGIFPILAIFAIVFLIIGIATNAVPFALGLAFKSKLTKVSFAIGLIGIILIFVGFILLFAL